MRKPRRLRAGAKYHVSARANNKEFIFASRPMKELFLHVLNEAKKHYSFIIENFCIMDNHVHLLIQPGDNENLSRIMQWTLANFAVAYNKQNDRSGHVWGERFFSRIINTLQEYLHIFDYIDKNPSLAGLVDRSTVWEYSGMAHDRMNRHDIVGLKPKIFFSLLRILVGNNPRFINSD
ncbi:hypothetical protein MASR2M78_09250 [Treponema sp.]